MSVIAFPKRAARTSPQHEPACVEVNATVPDCEAVRDMFKSARIRVLSRIVIAATLADDMKVARRAQDELTAIQAGLFRASKVRSEAR